MLLLPTLCRTKSFPATNVEGSGAHGAACRRPARPAAERENAPRPARARSDRRAALPGTWSAACGAAAPLTYWACERLLHRGVNTPRVLSVCAGAFKRGAVVAPRAAHPHGDTVVSQPAATPLAAAPRPRNSPTARARVYVTVAPRDVPREFPRERNGFGNCTERLPRLAFPRRATWSGPAAAATKNELAKYVVIKLSLVGSDQVRNSSTRLCGGRFATGTRLAAHRAPRAT